MNPTITGVAKVANMVTELRPTHVYKEAVDVSRDEGEFTRLLMKLKRRRYDDLEFRIVEEDAAGVFMTVTEINVGADALVFKVANEDAAVLAANTPVRLDNDSYAIITVVSKGATHTTITLDTDLVAAGMVNGSVLAVGAKASEDGSAAPDPVTFNPYTRVGYQQTLRIAWGETRWTRLIKSFVSETRVVSNKRQAFRLARQLVESGLIHNPMKKVADPLRYYTGGLYDQNIINLFDIDGDGSFTYEMLEDSLTAMKKSSKSLIGLCGTKIGSEIRKIIWAKNQNAVVEGEYMGVPVTHIRCGSKKITLLESANLDEGLFQYDMHVLDEKHIGIVTTQDQTTGKGNWFVLETNAQTPGTDGTLNVLNVDFGFEMTKREGQALFRNMKKGVKS